MNIRGKLHEIYNLQQVSDSFKKREFVLEFSENPQYPEFLKFEVIQDKCSLLDQFKVGQEVDVYFNLKGRKWTNPKGETLYFNSLQAWRMEDISGNSRPDDYNPPEDSDLNTFTDDDVLPF